MMPGPLQPEPDVKFLLVHHTAGTNDYTESAVVEQIRQVFRFHTGPDKQWPDVCYNFFVDRYGGIWEGRAGSLDGPVMADATGGSQGFDQLVCLLGNFVSTQPTTAMVDSTVAVLAYLADRYGIDTSPGAEVEFISRGSNRWPAGKAVTARTISGHRDMSATECPGQMVYDLLEKEIPSRVTAGRGAVAPVATVPASAVTSSSTTEQPTTTSVTTTTIPRPTTTAAPALATTDAPSPSTASRDTASVGGSPSSTTSGGSRSWAVPAALAAVGTGLLAAGIARRQRIGSRPAAESSDERDVTQPTRRPGET